MEVRGVSPALGEKSKENNFGDVIQNNGDVHKFLLWQLPVTSIALIFTHSQFRPIRL